MKVYVHNLLAEIYFQKYRNASMPFTNLSKRRGTVEEHLGRMTRDGDVLLLQECTPDDVLFLTGTFCCYYDPDLARAEGAFPMVAVRRGCIAQLVKCEGDGNGFVVVRVHAPGYGDWIYFASVHCTWGHANRWVEPAVASYVAAPDADYWVVGGDFNTETPALPGCGVHQQVPLYPRMPTHLSGEGTYVVYDHVFTNLVGSHEARVVAPASETQLLSHGRGGGSTPGCFDASVFHSDHAILEMEIRGT